MELNRKLMPKEEKLLEYLVKHASITFPENWKEDLFVCPMNNDGMGSLYLFPKGKTSEDRVFGKQVSDFQYTDKDGVIVIVSLNIDGDGDLFELDIWKTNFDKLDELPNI